MTKSQKRTKRYTPTNGGTRTVDKDGNPVNGKSSKKKISTKKGGSKDAG